MPTRTPRQPKLRHHKPTGQALVELGGRRIYLGRFGKAETTERYHRVVAEWIANGRRLPVVPDEITVVELCAAFWRWAEGYYGESRAKHNFAPVIRGLRALYGDTPAAGFGPKALKAVRQGFIDYGCCRRHVNELTGKTRRIFRFGVENELIPPDVLRGLEAVTGIRRGRMNVRESTPVESVARSTVDATLPHLTSTVRAMVQVQLLTGMRPGEVCIMRACDLDVSGRVWVYTPVAHKTAHFGRDRRVCVGPRAQDVLKPFLKRKTTAYLFSPAESMVERRAQRHDARKTPLGHGNRPGTNRKSRPKRAPAGRYTTQSYGRAIAYACERAWPTPDGLGGEQARAWRRDHLWTPNQVRHLYATEVRGEYGLEAAQVALGHARADVTQVYAERDFNTAVAVAAEVG